MELPDPIGPIQSTVQAFNSSNETNGSGPFKVPGNRDGTIGLVLPRKRSDRITGSDSITGTSGQQSDDVAESLPINLTVLHRPCTFVASFGLATKPLTVVFLPNVRDTTRLWLTRKENRTLGSIFSRSAVSAVPSFVKVAAVLHSTPRLRSRYFHHNMWRLPLYYYNALFLILFLLGDSTDAS
ncbi:hypothetical protein J6590_045986 [Homalodisca vitripennis]|nr:hypothetical protein J6590_045986 [Homalodisca vitripennis]